MHPLNNYIYKNEEGFSRQKQKQECKTFMNSCLIDLWAQSSSSLCIIASFLLLVFFIFSLLANCNSFERVGDMLNCHKHYNTGLQYAKFTAVGIISSLVSTALNLSFVVLKPAV